MGVSGIIADNKGRGHGRYSAGKNVPDRKIIGNITALPKPDPAAGEFAHAERMNPILMHTIVPITTIMYRKNKVPDMFAPKTNDPTNKIIVV